MTDTPALSPEAISAIIEMALSDHTPFSTIQQEYGLNESAVKAVMRDTLKPSSYCRWRKRVRAFGDRRAHYK